MAEIISLFNRARPRPSEAFRETPRQRAGRKRNPLRQHAERISLAVTIAGHLANGRADRLEGWGDFVAMLRRGADAARFLADEAASSFPPKTTQFHAQRFNANAVLLATWPLATYCFLRS
jgi:hypothetical protein